MVLDRAAWRAPEAPAGSIRLLGADDDGAGRLARRAERRVRRARHRGRARRASRSATRRSRPAAWTSSPSASAKRLTVTAVAEPAGGPVAAGAHQPVGAVTEVVGVATLPAVRRQGLGGAVTGALVEDALDARRRDRLPLRRQRGDRARLRAARLPADRNGVHRRLSAIDAFLDAGPRGDRADRGDRAVHAVRLARPVAVLRAAAARRSSTRSPPDDVGAVRARQRELELPETFQWVHETAPTLRAAMTLPVISVPLLVLEEPPAGRAPGAPARRRRPRAAGRPGGRAGRLRRARHRARRRGPPSATPPSLAVDARRPSAGGSAPGRASPRSPRRRRPGRGRHAAPAGRRRRDRRRRHAARRAAARARRGDHRPRSSLTRWRAASRRSSCRPSDDDVARVYERLGFRRAATACFVQ